MKVWAKRVFWALVVILVVIQVVRPAKTNPPIDPKNEMSANLTVPPEVGPILARSCNDCHSNRTVWPWYSNVAPVSWLVAYDVNHGRTALNFSEWGTRDPAKNHEMLGEICKEVTEKEMPGLIYPLMHSGAGLSDADIQSVCRWAQSVQQGAAAEQKPAP
jgi:Haem-binding domain